MARTMKQEPLEQVTHWRRLREIISAIADIESLSLKDYDTDNIRCYRVLGKDLKGKHVTAWKRTDGRICWVDDNKYDFYEIPLRRNSGHYEGEYLYLAFNTYYGYYVFGWMKAEIDRRLSKQDWAIVFEICYDCYGQYSASTKNGETFVRKLKSGEEFDPGSIRSDSEFDTYNNRLINGYSADPSKVLSGIVGEHQEPKKFIDKKAVPIYHKGSSHSWGRKKR